MEEYDGCSDRTVAAGSVIFSCAPADDVAVSFAKKYIKLHSLTAEDVKILKNKIVSVETKREIDLSSGVFDISSQDHKGE